MSENYNEGQDFDTSAGQPTPMKAFPWGSQNIGQIAGALAKAQGTMHNPGKSNEVKAGQYSYKYAPLNEVQDVARAALAENGIAVFQPVCGDTAKIEITTVLMHSSGEWLATDPLVCSASSAGNRGSAVQTMGGLITYLRRYSLCAALNLSAADDDNDGADEGAPAPARRGQDTGKPPATQSPAAAKPKDYGKPPERTPPAAAQPPKEQPKQEKPVAQPESGDMGTAQAQFEEALGLWVKDGWTKAQLLDIRKRMTTACAISSEDDAQWIVDDYYTFMARMDFEAAKKEWAAKGMTEAGLQEFVNGLHDAGEISSKTIDQLSEANYNHLMDVVDAELGIERKE